MQKWQEISPANKVSFRIKKEEMFFKSFAAATSMIDAWKWNYPTLADSDLSNQYTR